MATIRILGIDPGLTHTGIGIIDFDGFRSKKVHHEIISSSSSSPTPHRLALIHEGIKRVIDDYNPHAAAVEEVFVNMNPRSSLTLGVARGVALCVPALSGISVSEYTPNAIKKTVVGTGHADKNQIAKMVQLLLGCEPVSKDAADALAIAICHAHHMSGQLINRSRAFA